MKKQKPSIQFESVEQEKDFFDRYEKTGGRPFDKVPRSKQIQLVAEYLASVAMYRLKISGAVWFDGPYDPDSTQVWVRSIHKGIISLTAKQYRGTPLSLLEKVSANVEKPDDIVDS